MNLNLYYFESCPFCQVVLHEINNLKIKVKLTDINEDPSARDYLYQRTGRYTVPCLFINEQPMHESRDIIKWLKDNQDRI